VKTARSAVITGATSGIGLEAARQLAAIGYRVIGVGRSEARSEAARAAVEAVSRGPGVDYFTAELGSQREVRRLAERIRGHLERVNGGRLDALLNNAGAVSRWYVATEDGFETQFAVNYLSHFLLTMELLGPLSRSERGRVVTTSSGSHYRARMRWDDLMLRKRYSCLGAYKQAKLAGVLFTNELNTRLGAGSSVRAYAVDPGLVDTAIGEKGTGGLVSLVWRMRRRGGVSPDLAARGLVYVASEEKLVDPLAPYWKECRPLPASPEADREESRRRLWEVSVRLCGLEADPLRVAEGVEA